MHVRFETCERRRALGFLRKFYPNAKLEDKGNTKDVLDLVEADIIRIPDPQFHPGGRIYPSSNWDDLNKDQYMKTLKEWQQTL